MLLYKFHRYIFRFQSFHIVTSHVRCIAYLFLAGEIKTIGGGIRVPWTLFYAPAIRRMRKGIKRCPCPSVRPSVRPCVRPCVFPFVHHLGRYFVSATPPTIFSPILLKLYRCFCQGLKMCMTFGYNPQINFCHFFHSLNLVNFGLNYY